MDQWKIRKALGKHVMPQSLADTLNEELLPILTTKWLRKGTYGKEKEERPQEEVMELQPEFKEMKIPIVVSILEKNDKSQKGFTVSRVLLFDEMGTSFRFLLTLPEELRNCFILIPNGRAVAFYLDLDKDNDEFWRDHPNYPWDETLAALIAVVEATWKKMTGLNVPPPPWYKQLFLFSCKGKSKTLSMHLHTTLDPKSESFLPFLHRKSLNSFLKMMVVEIKAAYHDKSSHLHQAARILAHENEVERKGLNGGTKKERLIKCIVDPQGAGAQWRLPFCQKPGKDPMLPEFTYDPKHIGQVMRMGYPVLPIETAEKIPKEKLWDFTKTSSSSSSKTSSSSSSSILPYQPKHKEEWVLPDWGNEIKEMIQTTGWKGCVVKRANDNNYTLINKNGISCEICNRDHERANGFALVKDDEVWFKCYQDSGPWISKDLAPFKLKREIKELTEQPDFINELKKLTWINDQVFKEIQGDFLKLDKLEDKNKLECKVPIPPLHACPVCQTPHKSFTIEVLRTSGKVNFCCRSKGKNKKVQVSQLQVEEKTSRKRKREEVQGGPQKKSTPCSVKQSFDQRDPYCWGHFENYMAATTFESWDDMEDYFLQNINRVYAAVTGVKPIIKRNLRDDLFFFVDTFQFTDQSTSYKEMVNTKRGKEEVIQKISLRTLLTKFKHRLPLYSEVDFYPNSDHIPEDTFNIFPGYKAQLLDKTPEECIQHEGLQVWIKHTKEIMCNNDEPAYRQLTRVIQLLLRGPTEKIEGAHVLISPPGCGKNTYYDFLSLWVMGQKLTHLESGLQVLTGQYRDHLRSKLLVVADELAMNKEDYHTLWETLKNALSALYIVLDGKYIRKFKIKNLFYSFLNTNRNNAVFVEDMDRRFDFIQLSEKKMQNRQYFGWLKRRCFNQDTANHFFTWLVKTDEFEDVDPGVKVNNIRRRQAIESCLPPHLYFLGLLKQAYMAAQKIDEVVVETEPGLSLLDNMPVKKRVKPSELYALYKRWVEESGERKPLSQRQFKLNIQNHVARYKYAGQEYYYIDTVKINLSDSDALEAPPEEPEQVLERKEAREIEEVGGEQRQVGKKEEVVFVEQDQVGEKGRVGGWGEVVFEY